MRSNKVFPYVLNAVKGIATGFISLQVGLTHECLNRCVMCQHWARPKAGSLRYAETGKLIDHVIAPFVNMGGETICFSGGEPFNHPSLLRILKTCNELNLGIGFITSGAGTSVTGPLSDELLSELKKTKWLRISLDAVDPTIYKESRGPGYEQVMSNLSAYIGYGIKLGFGITAHKRNGKHIPEIIKWIKREVPQEQIESIRLWFVRGEPELELDADTMLAVKNEVKEALGDLKQLVDTNIDAFEAQAQGFPELPPDAGQLRCVVPLVHCYVDASLRAFACCIHAGDAELKPAGPAIGDMTLFTLRDLWDKVMNDEHHRRKDYGKHPSCAGCTLRLYTINKTMKEIEDGMLHRGNFL